MKGLALVVLGFLAVVTPAALGQVNSSDRSAAHSNWLQDRIDGLPESSGHGDFMSCSKSVALQQGPPNCENIGQGSCGGYNKDTKANCDPCSRPVSYRCSDGTYREGCTKDPGCGSNCD